MPSPFVDCFEINEKAVISLESIYKVITMVSIHMDRAYAEKKKTKQLLLKMQEKKSSTL